MPIKDMKRAIIAGASRGFGAAIAERLAQDGLGVTVNFAGRAADAEAIVGRIHTAGGQAIAVQGDIAAAVAFLVDPDGSWVNGQVLRANGGII
jgi:3-oxoacyl-[acyl-carrier protein] reductase